MEMHSFQMACLLASLSRFTDRQRKVSSRITRRGLASAGSVVHDLGQPVPQEIGDAVGEDGEGETGGDSADIDGDGPRLEGVPEGGDAGSGANSFISSFSAPLHPPVQA